MGMELLAPAGSWEALTAAVQSGADAVYLGGDSFSARQSAANFSPELMKRAVEYCHLYGVKVHTAVNTLVKEKELEALRRHIREITQIGVDAVIVQDLGAVRLFREISPDLPLHASTQMTVTSAEGAQELARLGFERIVLARELPQEEIARICRSTDAEIEVFCHGALCMCYSGQCLMSSIIGGRSGNRGRCAQPCRLPYTLNRDGKTVASGYLLSTKDLCLIDELGTLNRIGVKSLKIEGRLKKPEYVAAVVGMYRKYLDSGARVTDADRRELLDAFNRSGLTKGYFSSETGKMMMSMKTPTNVAEEHFSDDVRRRTRPDADIRKVPVTMSFAMRKDDVCRLSVSDGECEVEARGTQKSEAARMRPLDAARIHAQLAKTGGTPFSAEDIRLEVEDNITLPISELNRVRRAALNALAERRCQPPVRRLLPYEKRQTRRGRVEKLDLAVQVETEEQLKAVAKYDVAKLYVPQKLYRRACKLMPQAEVAVALPDIARSGATRIDADAVLAKSLAQLAQYRGARVYGDFRLNVYNSEAVRFLNELAAVTLSPELNLGEIRAAAEQTDATLEVIAYGRLPLMLMENCPIKASCGGCQKGTQKYTLKDRRGEIFPLLCGEGCVSVLLNAKPIFMADKLDELCRTKINCARLIFTVENFSKCDTIMNIYERAANGERVDNPFSPDEFTRGHFYRGVL